MKLTKEVLSKLVKEVKEEIFLELRSSATLNESSFNRIKEKIDNRDLDQFVVMSADRHERSRSQNDENLTLMKDSFKAAGYPFTDLQGSWVETDEKTGEEHRVIEKSIIVYEEERADVPRSDNNLFDIAKNLSIKFKQEAFIFGELVQSKSGQVRRVIAAYDQKGSDAGYGQWSTVEPIEKDAHFWSKVRGSTFVFKETIEVPAPNSVIEAHGKANKFKNKRLKFVRGRK